MRVIFINRYFHPDISATGDLLSELAFALNDRGMPATVIASRLRYEDVVKLRVRVMNQWRKRLYRSIPDPRRVIALEITGANWQYLMASDP